MDISTRLPASIDISRAKELCSKGYFYAPISNEQQDTIARVQEEFLKFLDRRPTDAERKKWEFIVLDEDESDEGIIRRTGKAGGDVKYFFHWRPTTMRCVEKSGLRFCEKDEIFFQLQSALYNMCAKNIMNLAKGLDGLKYHKSIFFCEVHHCYQNLGAYAAPVNRLLDYPSQSGTVRAGGHYDRGFVTMHMGDCGGYLYAYDEYGNNFGNISPKNGEALYFPGVKAYMLSHGKIKPLFHGSEAMSGERRRAIVHFSHVQTDTPVKNASIAYAQYRKEFEINT